jgi:ribosomal protein L37AE/L43A
MTEQTTIDGKKDPESTKHKCFICDTPAAVRESDGNWYCYEHHMDYCTGMSIADMKAGKQRGGLWPRKP